MLQDGGHCGCVPGGEGTPHPETRQCAHCGKLSMVAFDLQTNFDNYAMEAQKGQLLQLPSTVITVFIVAFSNRLRTFQAACHVLQEEILPV